jgi:putative ABC transport system permease protein
MRRWHILQSRLRSLLLPQRREADLSEELQFHLEREAERLQAAGLPEGTARLGAIQRFGGVDQIKEDCRDARGVAFVDDRIRDILYALRGVKRAPLVAFTIVSTVALGLGLVAAVFTVLNALVFRVDAVPDVHQMFAVARPGGDEPLRFARDEYDAFRQETSVYSEAYAQLTEVDSRVDGRPVYGTYVTGNFFQVLRVGAAMGRALTPADDDRSGGQAVVVLSHNGWDRLFARDPGVLGRHLLLNGLTFEIVGVMPEGFRGLAVIGPDDYWAPLSMLGRVSSIHQRRGVDIIGRLKPGLTPEAARAQLVVWNSNHLASSPINAAPTYKRDASRITLEPRRGTVPQPLQTVPATAPLFFAFGLILLIGCANVANLLLARGLARQREIGIRLSLGATRRRIISQLMTESLLLALVAAAAGYVIARVALVVIINALMTSIPPDIGNIRLLVPDADWRVVLFLIAGAVISTVAFALAPALHATRIEPVRTMRGEVGRDARPGRARNFLLGLQVSASALLLICAAVFLKSALTASTWNPGVRTSDTLIVQIPNEPKRNAIVEAIAAEPAIAAVAASWPDLMPPPANAESNGVKARVAYKFVSPELFSVLDVPIVRGRTFTAAERSATAGVAIVSETAARTIWPNADPVGQIIRLDAETSEVPRGDERFLKSQTFTVAGVARDVPGLRIAPFNKAAVYLPTSVAMPKASLIVRARGNSEVARQALLNRLTAVDPDMSRQVFTLRTWSGIESFFLQVASWLTIVLGGLALALTLSGLFSVLSYLVEQRTREIGIRMALGATTRNVRRFVLSQSIRPVAVGLVIGGGSAAGIAALLRASPLAEGIGEVVHVFDPVAYAASLLIIIAACLGAASIPATRAARLDPSRTLRQE